MRNSRSNLILLIVLQVVAIILYPPEFFSRAPQAALLPPVMFLLLVLALIGMNTGTLALESGRTALNMIQGLNIVVRLIMLFPNLKRGDTWDILLILAQLVGMGLSWYNMTKLDQVPLSQLRFRPEKS